MAALCADGIAAATTVVQDDLNHFGMDRDPGTPGCSHRNSELFVQLSGFSSMFGMVGNDPQPDESMSTMCTWGTPFLDIFGNVCSSSDIV